MTQALIGGEQVGARSGEETPVVNPATEEAFDAVPFLDLRDYVKQNFRHVAEQKRGPAVRLAQLHADDAALTP